MTKCIWKNAISMGWCRSNDILCTRMHCYGSLRANIVIQIFALGLYLKFEFRKEKTRERKRKNFVVCNFVFLLWWKVHIKKTARGSKDMSKLLTSPIEQIFRCNLNAMTRDKIPKSIEWIFPKMCVSLEFYRCDNFVCGYSLARKHTAHAHTNPQPFMP